MKAVMLGSVAVVALGGLGGLIFWERDAPADRSAPRAGVWPDEVAVSGVVEGARPEIGLRPEIGGAIAVLQYRENRDVCAGDVLVELRDATQREQVALAESELAVARANLERLHNGERAEKRRAAAAAEGARRILYEQAKTEYERAEMLRTTGAMSKEQFDAVYFKHQQTRAEWDRAKAERDLVEAPARADEVKAAEGRVASAEAALRLTREELAKTRLRAPCAGRILQVLAEPGEMAGPASERPVLILADLSRRRVRAFVEELDAPRLRVGQHAAVTADGLPGRDFPGTVAELMPRMGRRRPLTDRPGEYRDLYFREALIDLDEGDELPVNLRVRARIRLRTPE